MPTLLTNYSTLSKLSTWLPHLANFCVKNVVRPGSATRQLAERAGVDFSYISKLENGRLPAAADETVVRIWRYLGCPAEEFFTAAKKLPTELGESLVGEPAAIRFLQEASRLQLSQKEWERMLGELHGLRESDGRKEKVMRKSHSYSKANFWTRACGGFSMSTTPPPRSCRSTRFASPWCRS